MNNDFAFVARALETPCLFHFLSLKFHYVEETHIMLVAFYCVGKIVGQKIAKEISVKIC